MVIFRRFRLHVRRSDRRVPRDKIGKAGRKPVPAAECRHRLRAPFFKFQPPGTVYDPEAAKHLTHIVEHIPVRLNVIPALRINGKHLRTVRHRLNGRPVLFQLHPASLTAELHKVIAVSHGLKTIEIPVKPQHIIICLDLQALHRPVGL